MELDGTFCEFNSPHSTTKVMEIDVNTGEDSNKENCKHSFLKFLQDKMNVELDIEDIWKAHRMGKESPNKTQPMIVKVSYAAKELIMEHVSTLKDKTDVHGQALYIKEQIPEGIMEKKKKNSARLKVLNSENDNRPQERKNKIQVIQDQIIVNGEIDRMEVNTPQPADLFLDVETQKKVEAMHGRMQQTDPVNIRNSQFIGYSLKTSSIKEINWAYKALAQKHSAVDHIFMAYAIKEEEEVKHNHCDDGEHGGGNYIHRLLLRDKVRNTAIFVVRRYGGIHLGLERYQTIEAVSKEAIRLVNPEYISRPREDRSTRSKPRSIRGGRS